MPTTLYRRPLPDDTIAFSSPEGRVLFEEALRAGGLDGWFPLAEQFHTQADPAFCGLGSLVVALNALGIDPGRLWKGPWRWFAEDLLDCCVPLEVVRARGLTLDQLACLARCNGADVSVTRAADAAGLDGFRTAIARAARGDGVLIASYHRATLGQTGGGHFSPIGGWHAGRDRVLVLDVARFKYPPHWIPVERLWDAMQPMDPDTGKPRGFLMLERRGEGLALGFAVTCDREGWGSLAEHLGRVVSEIGASPDLGALAHLVAPLASHVEIRTPSAAPHAEALALARETLRRTPGWARVEAAIGAERAETATFLLYAFADLLDPLVRDALGSIDDAGPLVAELRNVRAQLTALGGDASFGAA